MSESTDSATAARTPPLADAASGASEADASSCRNCGADRRGEYCYRCGQHYLDDQLTLRVIWSQFAERFLKLERGLPATLRLALADPGRLARRFVDGERRRFVNPISFLLIGSAVAVLLLPVYAPADRMQEEFATTADSTQMSASMELGFRMGGGNPDSLTAEQRAALQEVQADYQERFVPTYLETIQQLNALFTLVLAALIAAWYKLFFSGRDRTFTFAETLVLGCYIVGAYSLVSSLSAILVTVAAPLWVGSAAAVVVMVALTTQAARGFYGRGAGNAALGALVGVLSFVAYLVAIVVLALPVVLFRM